jgi:putative colanic acid biosynthesis acetyltransferase WcaF
VGRIFINTHFPWPVRIKIVILRLFGATVGQRVMIKPKVTIKYPWFLIVEDDVWIGEHVWIDNLAQVTLKANVCLSQGAMLLTGNHDFTSSTFDLITKPIEIQEGVWIGAKSVVCPGVTCHSHAVLAVQSVATRSLEAYSVYQGNPAVLIRRRTFKK